MHPVQSLNHKLRQTCEVESATEMVQDTLYIDERKEKWCREAP